MTTAADRTTRASGQDEALWAALGEVIETTVAPRAREVDEQGRFPHESLDALAAAGLLGLVSAAEVGGSGGSHRQACRVIERLADACGSTAMITMMHYIATGVIEAHGTDEVRGQIAAGRHLTTLAFSEMGSRSRFWTPVSTATAAGETVRLDARKSWVTSAGEADSYVWSSRPVAGDGPMTLWLVPSRSEGLRVAGTFDGLGLRGNASSPVVAERVDLPAQARLGGDGDGLDIALAVVLPRFLLLNASFSIGLMEAVVQATIAHLTATRFEQTGSSLSQQPVSRAGLARMRMTTDAARALRDDTLTALETAREDAQLRVLEVKAVAAEAAIEVTEQAMRLCGGAAFRKEVGIERRFRDARAARVMAPTTDALEDFVGRALCGMPLFDEGNL